MPFRPELNYFYLYLQRYITEKYNIRVVRGDNAILTKALIEKIRDMIVEADLILGDISFRSPNVFYEIGLAHALDKPVVFLTQEPPDKAPADIRQFEFIHYDLENHEKFLSDIDNAIRNVFVSKYKPLFDEAIKLLDQFNASMQTAHAAARFEDFQNHVMRAEQFRDIPAGDDKAAFAEYILPKILSSTNDLMVMRKIDQWIAQMSPNAASAKPGE
jgi:hypothetical protein